MAEPIRLSTSALTTRPDGPVPWIWCKSMPCSAAMRRAFGDALWGRLPLAAHRASGGMAIVATHADIALPGAEVIDMAGYRIAIDTLLGAPQKAAGGPTAAGEPDYGEW